MPINKFNKLLLYFCGTISLYSCSFENNSKEAQQKINESEIAIYANKDINDLQVDDVIYIDYDKKSIESHKDFFSEHYKPYIKDIKHGLIGLSKCPSFVPAETRCFKITKKNIKFIYIKMGTYQCKNSDCGTQSVKSEMQEFEFQLKNNS